jgi:hypothetical protein
VRIVSSHLRAVSKTGLVIGGLVAWLHAKLETVEARIGIVGALQLWELDRDWWRMAIHFDLPEVLTESEASKQIAERRDVKFTFEECAWHMVDMELDDDELDADVKRQERRVRAVVKAGELVAVRGMIRYGDLADWLGEDLALRPTWAST